MMNIFDQGARLVPDIVTEAEERRILLRISQTPWLTDLSRRVQHYGWRYEYRGRGAGGPIPAPAFPRWAEAIADRLLPLFNGRRPDQCIVNEYRPGQGIGMHADHETFGPNRGFAVAGRRLADELPAPQRPPLRARRAGVRPGRPAAAPLGLGPARRRAQCLDARNRSCRRRAPGRDPNFGDVPHPPAIATPTVPVRAVRKAVRYPAGIGADGGREVKRSFQRGERGGDRERPDPFGNHRHQPG